MKLTTFAIHFMAVELHEDLQRLQALAAETL